MLENLQPAERRGVNQVAVNELLHMKISFLQQKKAFRRRIFHPQNTHSGEKRSPVETSAPSPRTYMSRSSAQDGAAFLAC